MKSVVVTCLLLAAAPLAAHAADENSTLRLDSGLIAPVGLVGLTFERDVGNALALTAGGGIGTLGVQVAVGARTEMNIGLHEYLYLDLSYSLAPSAQLEPDLFGGKYATGMYHFGFALAGFQYRTTGGAVFEIGVGAVYLAAEPTSDMTETVKNPWRAGEASATLRVGVGRRF